MKTRKVFLNLAVLALTVISAAAVAQAAERTYELGSSPQLTNITFTSVTDFETVLGSTNQLTGQVTTDLTTAQIELAIPVASLATGIDLRDEHLRSAGWLDAEKFPMISFTSREAKLTGEGEYLVRGDFTLHGVTRPLEARVQVRPIAAEVAQKAGMAAKDWLKITTKFEVNLSDHGVKIPDMAAAKVNDTWQVTFSVFAGAAQDGLAMQPHNN